MVDGGGTGFEFTVVMAGVADTVVTLAFVNSLPGQIDVMAAALDRAARVLTGAMTGTS